MDIFKPTKHQTTLLKVKFGSFFFYSSFILKIIPMYFNKKGYQIPLQIIHLNSLLS